MVFSMLRLCSRTVVGDRSFNVVALASQRSSSMPKVLEGAAWSEAPTSATSFASSSSAMPAVPVTVRLMYFGAS